MTSQQRSAAADLLSRICTRSPHLIDTGLELIHGMSGRTCPGRCVRAYLEFVNDMPHASPGELLELRTLIQDIIVIEALDSEDQLLEVLRFDPLPDESMEEFGSRILDLFRFDRAYSTPRLKLRFCYSA